MRFVVIVLLVGAASLWGCSKKCGPSNCSGCCDASGSCVAPTQDHCGLDGATCVACASLSVCSGGICTNPSPSGASTSNSSSSGTGSSGSTSTSTTGTHGTLATIATSGTGGTSATNSAGSTSGSGTSGVVLAPNVMFVVDKSGSMVEADSASQQGCGDVFGGYNGDRDAGCKWNDLLDVMTGDGTQNYPGFVNQLDSAFSSQGDQVRMGLTYFASDNQCGLGTIVITVPGDATDNAAAITREFNQLMPVGATPTAATLEQLAQAGVFPSDAGRANYVILLTDGAPNCDINIQATQASCGGDRCTGGTCPDWTTCSCNPAAGGDVRLCLDEAATVQAVADLYNANIKTFVIGMGADVVETAAVNTTLNEMGAAGGVSASLPDGGSYYHVTSSTDLSKALTEILQRMQSP